MIEIEVIGDDDKQKDKILHKALFDIAHAELVHHVNGQHVASISINSLRDEQGNELLPIERRNG